MLQKTRGIVVSFIKYGDTSVIVKIFTREMGLRSYIVNGVRSSSKSNKMAFYQPLTLLELVVYEKEGKNLQRISEVKLHRPHHRIPFDFVRSAVAMFVAEVLARSVVEGYQNEAYYDFLEAAVDNLDSENAHLSHFPIVFLLEGSKMLGFPPADAASFYSELEPILGVVGNLQAEKEYLDMLMCDSFRYQGKAAQAQRKNLLDHFLTYYALHLEIHPDWKSVEVLRQLMLG
jgi:DNA repair protein RecO (recombination protein O)